MGRRGLRKSHKRVDRHIHEEEEIKCVEVPSWFKYWHTLMFSPLIVPFFMAAARKYSTHLVVTNNRVLLREGVFEEFSKSVTFSNLTTVKVHQSIKGKLFNFGYLHIHTNTGGHADIHFHYIKNPIRVKKEIERGISEFEARKIRNM